MMATVENRAILGPVVRDRLEIYAELLRKWQRKINLIGPSTVSDVWVRHFDDSLQLLPLAGKWRNWVDLGSGGGFPGLVVALATDGADQTVHLIESDKRKAAFLREVSRETHAQVQVYADRIEYVLPNLISQIDIDVVSARALASLGVLIGYSRPILQKGGIGLFLKGKGLQSELTEAMSSGSLNLTFVDSRTDADARIVVVRSNSDEPNSV